MFDNLSKGLGNLIRKLVTGTTLDKKSVEEILVDLKRILLESDVDIQLTNNLVDEISKRCLQDKIPSGLTLREHVLKVIYEELVKLLGGKPSELLGKKRIMIVGLFGSGKCVHPESLIPLSDGRILKAKELYEEFSKDSLTKSDGDSTIVDVSNRNIFVPSFNSQTLKMENRKLTHLWKLGGKELLEVYLDNGNDFSAKVTPEHPFFVLRHGGLEQIRADNLTEEDYIAVPRYYSTKNSFIDIFPDLKTLDLDVKSNARLQSNKSIKQILNELPFRRNYAKLTQRMKNNIIPISLLDNTESNIIVKGKGSKAFINLPRYLTSEFAEFIGYVFGDGHLDNRHVEIVSEKTELIERIRHLVKILFGIEARIDRDSRTKSLYKIRINSKTLIDILNQIFGVSIGKKGRNLRIPKQILASNSEIVRHFVRAYFDCDSSASGGTREIELVSESRVLIRQMQILLLRFGIASSISKKTNMNGYWRLMIRARYAEAYAQKIGFNAISKESRASNYASIGLLQGCGKQDMIPLDKVLYETRMSLGFSIGEIQEIVSSYGQYENKGLISRESLLKLVRLYREKKIGFIARILLSVQKSEIRQEFSRYQINGAIYQLVNYGLIEKSGNLLRLTERGSYFISQVCSSKSAEQLNYLESLALSDVCWMRVQKLVKSRNTSDDVYDFTVDSTHSFIADGLIVHNTTTIGKLGRYFLKQGLKPALVGLDYYRPAAPEQLQQIGKQIGVSVYVDEKNKDPFLVSKNALEKYSNYDTIIFDTAGRNALDKELADELKKLSEVIRPDEVLLVIPADLGKVAKVQAEEFHKLAGVTGVIISKLDGTAKAGGALAATNVTGAKVKFIGTGEKLENLELYNPERFVSRLLGLGDLETLLEKAKDANIKKESVERIAEGKFTLQDFMEQIEGLGKMGPLQQIVGMIPGIGMMKIPEETLKKQEEKMKAYRVIIQSMNKLERENPDIITGTRIIRIAKGAGKSENEVRELINQYNQTKKMVKSFGGMKGLQRGEFKKLAQQFGLKM